MNESRRHERSDSDHSGPGEGDKQLFFGGGLHTWKLLAEDTHGAFFLFEDALMPGQDHPAAPASEADEMTYVLEGEIVVNVDGKESRVGAGGMSFVPRGTPHAFLVVSDDARLLTMQTPGSVRTFYRGASEPATGERPDMVDIDRVRASAMDNPDGVELLGPPPFEATT